jgi:hypothetical protein
MPEDKSWDVIFGDTLTKSLNEAKNVGIEHCIRVVKSRLPVPKDAQGLCVTAIAYELTELIIELEKLKTP